MVKVPSAYWLGGLREVLTSSLELSVYLPVITCNLLTTFTSNPVRQLRPCTRPKDLRVWLREWGLPQGLDFLVKVKPPLLEHWGLLAPLVKPGHPPIATPWREQT